MKDFKNDSTSVLTRFGRDKRQRTVTATAERVAVSYTHLTLPTKA